MRKRKLVRLSIIIFALFLGFLATTAASADEDFSGDWSGTWICPIHGRSGPLYINLTQVGADVVGITSLIGKGNCSIQNWPLTGVVNINVLNCEANGKCSDNMENSGILQFSLRFSTNNNIAGYYTYLFNGAIYCRGTVALTRSVNFINATAGAGGTIIPAGKISVNAGTDKTFQIVPNNGYKIKDVIVDGVSVGAKTSYTFSKVSANHTITATFETASTATGSIVPTIVAPLLLEDE